MKNHRYSVTQGDLQATSLFAPNRFKGKLIIVEGIDGSGKSTQLSIRVQDARFQALIGDYENTVLRAQGEVENAIAAYLGAPRQVTLGNQATDERANLLGRHDDNSGANAGSGGRDVWHGVRTRLVALVVAQMVERQLVRPRRAKTEPD